MAVRLRTALFGSRAMTAPLHSRDPEANIGVRQTDLPGAFDGR
jgi:hypothetical protein